MSTIDVNFVDKPLELVKYDGFNPVGWLMSEKLDGFRCIWTGEKYLSRQGHEMHLPARFYKGMPNIPLDGELYAGRQSRRRLIGLMKTRLTRPVLWPGVFFHVFDLPISELKFSERCLYVESIILPSHCKKVLHYECSGEKELIAWLDDICLKHGEGIVLRHPNGLYSPGRQSNSVKVKPHYIDLKQSKRIIADAA